MKKLILSITAIAAFLFSGYSQCTPAPQFTAAGIYPDSATGLSTAYVGNAYDEVITVVVPADTLAENPLYVPGGFFPEFLTVIIYDITLTSVVGLPSMMSYSCSPSDCIFLGGQVGCLSLYSTSNPTTGDIGLYPLTINTTTHTDIIDQDDIIDYYFIEIMDSAGMSVQSYNSESFELKTIYPNPVVGNSKIQFISGKNQAVTFTVMNVLGKTMVNRSITAKRGVNELTISSEDFSNGIYLYSITADGKTSTKRMVIRK